MMTKILLMDMGQAWQTQTGRPLQALNAVRIPSVSLEAILPPMWHSKSLGFRMGASVIL
ncbi:hypothetical protein [Sulfobacillus sp. hq2]|uniref:hypothetical protein n=1 Tax=Sulfobacillus TaxID=28033 RepID=UPI001304B5BD|nr:hypothetical protein [Sulfobacillus sp. hq2]